MYKRIQILKQFQQFSIHLFIQPFPQNSIIAHVNEKFFSEFRFCLICVCVCAHYSVYIVHCVVFALNSLTYLHCGMSGREQERERE